MNNYTSHKIKNISFLLMIMVVILHSYNIDTKQGGQILYFDKGFNWIFQNFISNGLTRIAVPLFFIISGYLFVLDKKYALNDFSRKIKKRIKTLVIPYLSWAIIGLLLYFILQSIPQSQSFFTKKLIKDYSLIEWVNAIFVDPIPYQLWFLRDLIVLVFLSPLIYWLVKNLKLIFLFFIFCFWLFSQDSVLLTSEALLFFATGIYINIFFPAIIEVKNKFTYSFLGFWIALLVLKTTFGFYEFDIILQMLVLKSSIIVGIIAFWKIYDKLSRPDKVSSPFFTELIGLSFFLYLFHEPFLTIVKKFLFSKFPKTPDFYLLIYVLASVITIIITLLIGYLFKSKFNSVYKFFTGNR